jgi:hypothetical protein
MGENAAKEWEWHNTEVGVGYASQGVIRQPALSASVKIVDMTQPIAIVEAFEEKKKSKKNKKKKNSDKEKEKASNFNPFIQVLATRMSDTTREFVLS